MNCGIYEIVNKITNKKYIGSSKDLKDRWRRHKCLLQNNKHHSIRLQRAWNKYGEQSFYFDIIHPCLEDTLLICEQWMIDQYDFQNDLYNISLFSYSTMKGRIPYNKGKSMSKEQKNKLSCAKKGKLMTNKWSIEIMKEMNNLFLTGISQPQIAKKYNTTSKMVHNLIKRFKLHFNDNI